MAITLVLTPLDLSSSPKDLAKAAALPVSEP
jgi:hypothetical protein